VDSSSRRARRVARLGTVVIVLGVAALVLAACTPPKKPPPVTTTTTSAPVDPLVRMLELVNEARADDGLVLLTACENLREAAARHSTDMADNALLSHTGSDGSMPLDRAADAGYGSTTVTENIALDDGTADEVFDMLIDSPGHAANILDPNFRHVGHAVEQGYWTQVFGAGGTC
jgi:uncharacterized protein YkwD